MATLPPISFTFNLLSLKINPIEPIAYLAKHDPVSAGAKGPGMCFSPGSISFMGFDSALRSGGHGWIENFTMERRLPVFDSPFTQLSPLVNKPARIIVKMHLFTRKMLHVNEPEPFIRKRFI
jgi:hypothetical protein